MRGIIVQKGKILACKIKKNKNWFFPGGHVEFGETAERALKRELKEEIGVSVKKAKFIGANENFYQQRGKILHEVNIVFEASLNKDYNKVLEDHMEFKWINLKSLPSAYILPESLKKSIIKWLKSKKLFWGSQGFKK